ncbi:hypothetical protein ACIRA0001_2086 [Acinetobacter radioresistens SK82]|uniref:Uncharacterized protein n=1 Tax=Acinetobacter radioresistens SK82 TaxID=596318 RepID=A0ABM9YLS3_ACIRA|nr:hypothetical protein [Acinetobacter radioresistens]EET81954.1 hypothetical protein ACIRA0001_2086 [Acinetobacter radioresistens SK82]QMU06555.1 hypothetical protein FOC39_06765 [Acinetobacter radioresistens]
MNESNLQIFKEHPEIGQLEKLSDKEIFGFLKRYYTDSYQLLITQKKKIQKGIFRETIETLERLYERLELVEEFIGYTKVDWEDACLSKNEARKKQIVEFYNDLVIDVALMDLANTYYKLPEKIYAFINFLDEERSCIFRSEIQSDRWKVEDFPYEEVFETIDRYKQYLGKQKNYKFNFDQDKDDEIAREILDVLHDVKKITQALVLIKFQIQDFSDKEIKNRIKTGEIDHSLATAPVERKIQLLVEDLNGLRLGTHLPWLSILRKGEIELNGEVRLMLGFILDSSTHKIDTNQIKESLYRELKIYFRSSGIASFIRSEIIAIDQIFDHLGAKEIKEFKLPNRKKLALMLKWFVGLFYGMGKIISPDNHTAESELVDTPIRLVTRKADDRLKDRNDKKKSKRQEKNDLEKKSYDFNSVWEDTSLIKHAPEYAKSIHKFYEMLKYFDELDAQQIKLLQRVNLFLAYLEDGSIDNLATGLSINPNPSKWPNLVRMYLALLDNSRDIDFSGIANWTIYNTSLLQRNLSRSSLKHQLNDRNLAEVTDLIARELEIVKQSNISIPQSKLCYMEKLAQKNAISARRYLKNSFKETTVLLRFKIDNSESRLEISSLKIIVTQFLKKAKRAPKSIGAHLDAYIGYFVLLEGRYYSIDCTAIFYLRAEAAVDDIKFEFENYWKEFTKRYTAKQKDTPEFPNLRVIPSLWFKEGGSQYFVVNKRDKLISQLINDLVNFYTAYEYFSRYKNTRHSDHKRPELFLRGRIKEVTPKKTDENNIPQDEVSMPENKKSVNEINENSSPEEANRQLDIQERGKRLARSLLPL